MKSNRIILTSIAMTLTLMAVSAPARAQDERKLLLLIDASFSMTTSRTNTDHKGATRFEAARTFASERIDYYEGLPDPQMRPLKVAIYTFRGDDSDPVIHTNGFATTNDARDALACLTGNPAAVPAPTDCNATFDHGVPFDLASPAGNTPLARALCMSADLMAHLPAGDARFLELTSDGEENSTVTGDCFPDPGVVGVFTPTPPPGTWGPSGSWQSRVISHFSGKGISVHTDLLETPPLPIPTLRTLDAPSTPDPEGILTPEARLLAITPSASTGLNALEQFFTSLAQVTGGALTIIFDDQPLPVIGDQNRDRCVDHNDAIPVARAFGPIVPPTDGTFDLNVDGVVDFNDYLIQLSLISGTCGRDPYVARQPLVCKGSERVVIDGQSIEDRDITIDARGACEIVIKNSLIVSGKNAIKVVGSASITVDNSIIVGQDAVITQHGAGVLSAANSVFHGKIDTVGAFQYIDRGGNVFE